MITGTFSDINNKTYTIEIAVGSDSKEITLGEDPVVIEYQGDSILYKPCKYSTATIRLVSDDYLFNLYASTAQQNKVVIKDGSNIIWVGYLTPNLYNMGYEKVIEEIELEAIDALSTLQYFDYRTIDGTSKDVVSFHDLIIHLLKRCNSYNSFHFPNEYILEKLYISEENFFNEDGDAMTYQEVLEEICKYMGLTCIAFGNDIYFLDYDSIKIGNYTKVNISNGSKTTVTLNKSKEIVGDDYAENGGQISLDNVYNKVIVKDSLYSFEMLMPSLFEDVENITSATDTKLQNSTSIDGYGEIIGDGDKRTIAFLSKVWNYSDYKYANTCAVGIQYLDNKKYRFYDYVNSNKATYNYSDTQTMKGSVLARIFVKNMNKSESEIDSEVSKLINKNSKLETFLAANDVNKFEYDDYLIMTNPKDGHISNANATSYPYFETDITNGSALFGGDNAYILITGSMFYNVDGFNSKDIYPIPTELVKFPKIVGNETVKKDSIYHLCKLQWGDKYWNGDEWVSNETTFKLYYTKADGNYSFSNCVMKEFQIMNNVVFHTGIGEKGYCIKCPVDTVMTGLPKLTMYKPMDFERTNKSYDTTVMFLKNLEIKAILGDPTFSDENETDTEYSNVINEEFVSELDPFEFKICTWDNKSPNYSCVGIKENGTMKFLDTVNYNNKNLRFEEHFIERLVNQYSTPSIILDLNLKNNGITPYMTFTDKFINGKIFVIDSFSLDLHANKNTLKLLEKK